MSPSRKFATGTPSGNIPIQVDSLATAGARSGQQLLVDLLSAKIGRIRLFDSQSGTSEMIREIIGFPAREIGSDGLTQKEYGRTGDPEITVDLILQEDGAIDFSVESEVALVGESLAALEKSTANTEGKAVDGVDPETDDFISARKIAEELGVCKTTITRRIKDNRLLGYQGFKRDWLIPRAQFNRRTVVPGIEEMIALFDGDHRETWFFLSSNFFYGDAQPRPIDRLRALRHNDKVGLDASLAELESLKESYEYGDHS